MFLNILLYYVLLTLRCCQRMSKGNENFGIILVYLWNQ